MNIEWTKCSERMPNLDDTLVIVNVSDRQITINNGFELGMFCSPKSKLFNVTKWCEFTQEKWEFLNK